MQRNASKIMEKLYGKEHSEKVYDRLESLNHSFNRAVQDIAYDYFWALPGLSMREKSFITLVSLIVLQKEEQTKIHYYGFLHERRAKEELLALLRYLEQFVNIDFAKKLLEDVLNERDEKLPGDISALNERDQEIAQLAATAALADKSKMQEVMVHYLKKYADAHQKMECILMHQIVYCGFPVAMNGFAILQELTK